MRRLFGFLLGMGMLLCCSLPGWTADAGGSAGERTPAREKPYLTGIGFAFPGDLNQWLSFEIRVRGLARTGSTKDGVQTSEFLPGREGVFNGWIALEEETPGKGGQSAEPVLAKYALKIINPRFESFEADILPVGEAQGDQLPGAEKGGKAVVPIGHLSLRMVRNAFEGTMMIKTQRAETSNRMTVLVRETTKLEEKLEDLSLQQAVPADPR